MGTSDELQAWKKRLHLEHRQIVRQKRLLAGALAAGVLFLLIVVWGVYEATVGSYASIDRIEISQHPADQGRLRVKFRVLRPGKVYYRRSGGGIETDVVDSFSKMCSVDRPWPWVYRPGEEIEVQLWYRRGLFRRTHQQTFATVDRADVVVLIDTTESMDESIGELIKQCGAFSENLTKKALTHRFALVGFGDTYQGSWVDTCGFTSDVEQFLEAAGSVERFRSGNAAESALDALEEALSLTFDEHAIRRFYLVTDAGYHQRSRSGATAHDVMVRLEKQNVSLCVFSQPKFKADYAKLLGETGRFRDIRNFGKVLRQGRFLGD